MADPWTPISGLSAQAWRTVTLGAMTLEPYWVPRIPEQSQYRIDPGAVGGVMQLQIIYVAQSPERVPRMRADRALAALRSFREGDTEEQRETLARLMRALDEDRPEGQKLFPEQ